MAKISVTKRRQMLSHAPGSPVLGFCSKLRRTNPRFLFELDYQQGQVDNSVLGSAVAIGGMRSPAVLVKAMPVAT